MLIGQFNSGVYQLVLILHILSVVVAFAPAVVHPMMANRLKDDEAAARRFFAAAAINSRAVYLPALAAVGILGFALVGLSDPAFEFSDPWVGIAVVLWLAIAGIISGVVLPGERKVAAGEAGAAAKVQAGGSIATVLFLIVLFLMVVKPGG